MGSFVVFARLSPGSLGSFVVVPTDQARSWTAIPAGLGSFARFPHRPDEPSGAGARPGTGPRIDKKGLTQPNAPGPRHPLSRLLSRAGSPVDSIDRFAKEPRDRLSHYGS